MASRVGARYPAADTVSIASLCWCRPPAPARIESIDPRRAPGRPPECRRLLPGILAELGCDPQQTCFDVPRMRTSTSNDYLTTGIAYAFRPHRDTWYTRTQPTAQQPLELEPSIVLLPPVGGIIAFSANQLHSSIPNRSGKTRLSIDFRTVHSGDAEALRGAVNLDAYCTGSAIDDYLRCSDLSHLPERVQRLYAAGHPQAPVLAPQRDAATP